MKFNLINDTKPKLLKRGELAIMENDYVTRIVLVESLEGDTFTGTVVYYHNACATDTGTDYPVGTYTEGWAYKLYRPFAGKLTIDI